MDGGPQGLILGLIFFNMFISNMDDGMEYRPVVKPDCQLICRAAFQSNLKSLKEWADS